MPFARKTAPRRLMLSFLQRINEVRRQLRDQEAMLVVIAFALGGLVGLAVAGLHRLLLAAQGRLGAFLAAPGLLGPGAIQ